jgi:hypothetical protein
MTGGGILAVCQNHYDELLRFVARRVLSRPRDLCRVRVESIPAMKKQAP